MIEIYAGNTLIQTIRKVMTASLRETLEGEFTLSFTVLAKSALALKTKQVAKIYDQYFEIVQITKSLQGSLPVCSVTCEHVSYILNDEVFTIYEFDFTGDPAVGLSQVLSGTPFSAGTVDFTNSCTMKINQEVTRRAALMQYIAILGGEIEYDGYQINIRSHRGSSEYQSVMDSKNVTNVSVTHDSRENASSYEISFFKLLNLAVGDNVHIVFRPLGIDVRTRIISLEYNPFYRYNIRVEVGRYKPSISDTFYRMENSLNTVESSLNEVGSSVDGLQFQMDQLQVSYTLVKNLTIDESYINVTYEVEKGDTHQYFAKYSYTTDANGRITSITLEDIFSELLLKEVSTLLVDATRFEITYKDGEIASYNYTTDSNGRITGIEKVVEV
ncbi:hypothetical protein [Schinkia azotoformans]|uniref:hypothetical protein n=1 Tax=Schinkia azotoformans TaxID=1454 RepID=UPI002DBE7112|nr:hypothetical protein [Schinkia azotoformans]MEC1771953.1 hypothetical protein [Schinkia azotoformans]MED4366451.1 hypothetical protein [Schinkia azotoformans]